MEKIKSFFLGFSSFFVVESSLSVLVCIRFCIRLCVNRNNIRIR